MTQALHAGITIKAVGVRKFEKNMAATKRAIDKARREWLLRTALMARAEMKRLASGAVLKVRSGRYRAAINHKINYAKSEARVGNKVIYARLREYGTEQLAGGVLEPRKKQWLTIPIPGTKAMTRAGVGKRARDFKKVFFIKSKKGNLILMGSAGDEKPAPLFVLKKSVKQKKRPVVYKTARAIEAKVFRDAKIKLNMAVRSANAN